MDESELIKRMKGPSLLDGVEAVRQLGAQRFPEGPHPEVRLLMDPDPNIASVAAYSLEGCDGQWAAVPLLEVLERYRDDSVKGWAANSISSLQPPIPEKDRIRRALENATTSASRDLRSSAIYAIGRMGFVESRQRIWELMFDECEDIQSQALNVYNKLMGTGEPPAVTRTKRLSNG
jgi:HEAT repeat protein